MPVGASSESPGARAPGMGPSLPRIDAGVGAGADRSSSSSHTAIGGSDSSAADLPVSYASSASAPASAPSTFASLGLCEPPSAGNRLLRSRPLPSRTSLPTGMWSDLLKRALGKLLRLRCPCCRRCWPLRSGSSVSSWPLPVSWLSRSMTKSTSWGRESGCRWWHSWEELIS